MESQKRLAELNALEFLNRATKFNDNVAKGAQVLYKHDVNGDVFLAMTNDDFKELGIKSFGIIRSLIMFRDKVLESEALSNHNDKTTPKGPQNNSMKSQSLEPISDNPIAEASTEEVKEVFDADMSEMIFQPGGTVNGEISADLPFTISDELFLRPESPTLQEQGEHDVVGDCGSCLSEYNMKEKKMPRVDYRLSKRIKNINETDISRSDTGNESLSEIRYVDKKKKPRVQHLSAKDIEDNNDLEISRLGAFEDACSDVPSLLFVDSYNKDNRSTGSANSLVSSRSILRMRKLKDWVISERITWEEDGKRRSADTYMQLRNDNEILLEGKLQKLTGVNSKWMVNHWTSRYGILLKSRVFLLFHFDRKSLYPKSSADLRLVANIGIPQRDISAGILKFEIFLETNKRIVLGFKTESRLNMWRNDISSLVQGYDNPDSEEEKEKM